MFPLSLKKYSVVKPNSLADKKWGIYLEIQIESPLLSSRCKIKSLSNWLNVTHNNVLDWLLSAMLYVIAQVDTMVKRAPNKCNKPFPWVFYWVWPFSANVVQCASLSVLIAVNMTMSSADKHCLFRSPECESLSDFP